jgi:hypothetical protein
LSYCLSARKNGVDPLQGIQSEKTRAAPLQSVVDSCGKINSSRQADR